MSDSVQPRRWQPTRLLCPWDSPSKSIILAFYKYLLNCQGYTGDLKEYNLSSQYYILVLICLTSVHLITFSL